jgi:4-amino-4-deoxy-L-arabinose transferase-like glycosyltransferase
MIPRHWTVGLMALAAVTRIVAALVLGDRFHFIDETIYVDAARRLLAGEGFGATYANVPAQPVFLAALAAPWPERLVLLRCAHALVVGVLGTAVLQALGTRTVGTAATLVALALYALDPLIVVAGGLLYPEAIAAVVLAGCLLAAVIAAQDDRYLASAAAGLLLGLTILFRPVAVVLIPVLLLWNALAMTAPRPRRLRHALLALATCALTVAPWVSENLAQDGQVVPVGMAGLQNAPVRTREIHRDGLATSMGREAWRHPVKLLRRVGHELAAFWELYPTRLQTDRPELRASMHGLDARLPTEFSFPPSLRDVVSAVSFGVEMVLALAGLVIGWRSRRTAIVLFAGVALVYGLGYALFVAKLRYRIVVLPGIFLLAGIGAAAFGAIARRSAAPATRGG